MSELEARGPEDMILQALPALIGFPMGLTVRKNSGLEK
jgi:hypothetical protein